MPHAHSAARAVFVLCLLLSAPLLAYVSRQAQGAVRRPAPAAPDPAQTRAHGPQDWLARLLRADPCVVAIDPGPEGTATVNVFVRHDLDHAGLVAAARRLRDRLARVDAPPGCVRVSAGRRGDVVLVQALPTPDGGSGLVWTAAAAGRLLP